jgi:hypothetical protein
MADISQLLRSSGIDAQRTATDLFGAAVEDFAAKPLNGLLNSVTGRNGTAAQGRNDPGTWYATSYAASLANSQYRPKLKFMFRVEFLFEPKVLETFGRAEWQKNFTFLVKTVDRPKVDFEYEDVNQYNFRTKVLKQIKHRELTLSFTDDVGNHVYEFFRFMMMVHSPITRRSAYASSDISAAYATYTAGSGMEFTKGLGPINDFAHRGAVDTDLGNAIRAIKITQIFINPSDTPPNAAKEVSFFFINPRVTSFDLDDVSHEASDPNLFTMQFDYDFMVMSKQELLKPLSADKSLPPVGTAPGEAAPTPGSGTSTGYGSGAMDPYIGMLAGIGGRAVQKITSDTVGKALRTIPGLGSVADNIGGITQGIARDQLAGIGQTVNQAFARPGRDIVTDLSTAGRDAASYITSIGSGGFGSGQPSVNVTDLGGYL